jgi:hypothetical protein
LELNAPLLQSWLCETGEVKEKLLDDVFGAGSIFDFGNSLPALR